MNRIAELDHYVSYCERIKHELLPLRAELPEEVRPRLDAVLRKADSALKTSRGPVKIGVVGEFSSGKTLVLGALMGSADLLPVNEVPTTGNITEIRFGQLDSGTGDKLCRIARCRIRFLTRDQVFECRTYMVEQAVAVLGKIGMRPDLITRLDAVRANDGSPSWQELETCCAEIWRETKNPEIRFLIRDLMQLARVYPGAGAALCGQELEVTTDVVYAALALPDAPSNLQEVAFSDVLPPAVELSSVPSPLDKTTARAAFHLIHSCELQVSVARKIWDLSGLKGQNELVLLDFPGLGASGSSVRDAYLCRREMAQVQTILLLINGYHAGSGEAATLFSMMQEGRPGSLRDAILVGIGRFDQLRIQGEEEERLRQLLASESNLDVAEDDDFFPSEEAKGVLDDEVDDDPNPADRPKLTEEDVRKGIRALNRVLSDAGTLTADLDRTLLLSPVIYLGELSRHLPGTAIADRQLKAELERWLASAEVPRGLWKDVIDKLSKDGSAGQLVELLAELVKDGGIGRLRRTLGSHVAAHGVRQLVDTVIRCTDEVAEAVKQLCRAIPDSERQPVVMASDGVAELADYLRDLKRAYTALKTKLRDNPPDLMYEAPSGRTMRLVDHFREEVEARVSAWPEWRNLFVSINADTSLVDLRKTRRSSILDDIDGGGDDEDTSEVPLCGADLKPRFRATYDELRQKIEQLAQDAIDDWLDAASTELAAKRQHLSTLINDDTRRRIVDSGNKRGGRRLGPVLKAMEPRRLKDALFKQALQAAGATAQAGDGNGHVADRFFPLRDERRFGWDPSLAELVQIPPQTRHHAQVLRLRTTLVAALSRELKETVSRINKEASQLFTQAVNEIATQRIEDCLADDELLRSLVRVGPNVASSSSKPDTRGLCQSLYDAKPGI